ncbi:MAG: serine protease [Marivivens sp.]|nr:serine protease [Marivivens sp.]
MITAQHVIASGARPLRYGVRGPDKQRLPVFVVVEDPSADFAVLYSPGIRALDAPKLECSRDAAGLGVGAPVLVGADNLNFHKQLFKGIISATDSVVDLFADSGQPGPEKFRDDIGIIVSDTRVYPGGSGGPIVSAETGQVIGFNSMMIAVQGAHIASLHINITNVIDVIDDLQE